MERQQPERARNSSAQYAYLHVKPLKSSNGSNPCLFLCSGPDRLGSASEEKKGAIMLTHTSSGQGNEKAVMGGAALALH